MVFLLGPQCFTTRIESIPNVVQQLYSDTLVGRTNGRLQNEKEQQRAIPKQGIDASGFNRHGCEPILLHKSSKKKGYRGEFQSSNTKCVLLAFYHNDLYHIQIRRKILK